MWGPATCGARRSRESLDVEKCGLRNRGGASQNGNDACLVAMLVAVIEGKLARGSCLLDLFLACSYVVDGFLAWKS